jgi:hypothetical protein
MVTFTLPYELRSLAWRNQTAVYNILFTCAAWFKKGSFWVTKTIEDLPSFL